MKVIGAGIARTGTTSTKGALEELGFGPCYTFFTLFSRPADIDRWIAAYAGERIDWEEFFEEFESTVDHPSCDFFEEHMARWPDAPVILTVREPEGWYKSVKNTIWALDQEKRAAGNGPDTDGIARLLEVMLWQRAFDGKFLDQDYAIGYFNRHIERVKAKVPSDRLLVFDVKQGWEPLCRFLDVPAPDKPFPRLNDTDAFLERARGIRPGAGGPVPAASAE